jgi:hypothetical protein
MKRHDRRLRIEITGFVVSNGNQVLCWDVYVRQDGRHRQHSGVRTIVPSPEHGNQVAAVGFRELRRQFRDNCRRNRESFRKSFESHRGLAYMRAR